MATITWEVIRSHNKESDAWIVLHGKVYNVTGFFEDHPGGKDILLELAGQDATVEFEEAAHSTETADILPSLMVGCLHRQHDTALPVGFDASISVKRDCEKGSWMDVKFPILLALVAATWLIYKCSKIYGMQLPSRRVFSSLDILYLSLGVIISLSTAGLWKVISYVIYVDYGRLDKYPPRLCIEQVSCSENSLD